MNGFVHRFQKCMMKRFLKSNFVLAQDLVQCAKGSKNLVIIAVFAHMTDAEDLILQITECAADHNVMIIQHFLIQGREGDAFG